MSAKLSIGALGLLALALGTLQSVVEPALPLLQQQLGVGPAEGALVANTLLVTGAVVAPIAGKLGDRYGGKRVLLWLVAIVSAGGVCASLAPSLPLLLAGQVLQGVMVGALPLSFILVRQHLSTGGSQATVGVVVALFTGGGIVGTLIAGPIAEGLTWHGIFALPTAVIIAAGLAVALSMPHDPPRVARGTTSSRPRTARSLIWPAYALTFALTASFGLVAFLIPQLFSRNGVSATAIGFLLLPSAIAGALADSVGGVAARRFGTRAVVAAGLIGTAVTMTGLALLSGESWQLTAARVLVAFASGAGTTALLAGTATTVDAGNTGTATSLLVVTRVIGVAVGAQIGGALLSGGLSYATGFLIAAAIATAALFIVRAPEKHETHVNDEHEKEVTA
jgi:predicted MFS family arabinose efflux permease